MIKGLGVFKLGLMGLISIAVPFILIEQAKLKKAAEINIENYQDTIADLRNDLKYLNKIQPPPPININFPNGIIIYDTSGREAGNFSNVIRPIIKLADSIVFKNIQSPTPDSAPKKTNDISNSKSSWQRASDFLQKYPEYLGRYIDLSDGASITRSKNPFSRKRNKNLYLMKIDSIKMDNFRAFISGLDSLIFFSDKKDLTLWNMIRGFEGRLSIKTLNIDDLRWINAEYSRIRAIINRKSIE